jgi:hypothetical protein
LGGGIVERRAQVADLGYIGGKGQRMNRREIVIYVAGPYTAATKEGVKANISEAAEVAAEIRRAGFSAVVPHLESLYNIACISEGAWIEHGIALLRRCDAIFDFRRGRKSAGTEIEVRISKLRGMPRFTTVTDLVKHYEA